MKGISLAMRVEVCFHCSSACEEIVCSFASESVVYRVVPKGFLTFLGFLGNAEFSPLKRLPEFIEPRKS